MKEIDVEREVIKIMEIGDYREQFHKILGLMAKIFNTRDNQYGDFQANSEQIARLQSDVFKRGIKSRDIPLQHILTKINRISNGEEKADNFIDGANYFILMLLCSYERKTNIRKVFQKWEETGVYETH